MRAQVVRMHAPERHAEHEPEYHDERHHPEECVLYRVVSTHWGEFRERIEAVGSLPKFVVRDVEEYLRCGILEAILRARRALYERSRHVIDTSVLGIDGSVERLVTIVAGAQRAS